MKKTLFTLLALGMLPVVAQADIYGFREIGGPTVLGLDETPQLTIEVIEVGPGQIQFNLQNNTGDPSAIAGIYFDDDRLLGYATIHNGPGADFSQYGLAPFLPGGDGLSDPFVVTPGLSFDPEGDGLGNGESLTLTFNLLSGRTFDDVIEALDFGLMRVGILLNDFRSGLAGYITESHLTFDPDHQCGDPVNVPAPGAALLGMMGLGLVGWFKRRFA